MNLSKLPVVGVVTKHVESMTPDKMGKVIGAYTKFSIPTKDGIKYADNMLDAFVYTTGRTIEGYQPGHIIDVIS